MDSALNSSSSSKNNEKRQRKPNKIIHRCTFCGKISPSPSAHQVHLRVHTGEKPFSCPRCPFTTGYKNVLVNHQRTHNPDLPRHHNCSHVNCNYAAKTLQLLKSHIKSHIETKDRPLKCRFCPCRTNRREILHNHIRSRTKEKVFKCQICLKDFSTKSYLKKHHQVFHSESDYSNRPFPCTFEGCSYRAKWKYVLQQHLQVHVPRSERIKFKCEFPECSKICFSVSKLKSHQRMHTCTEKKFKCTAQGCQFAATRKVYLKKHMDIHSEQFKFICQVTGCSHKSRDRSHMRTHVKRVHTKSEDCKMHSCDLCEYKSKMKADIQSHKQRMHARSTVTLTCHFPGCPYKTQVKAYMSNHNFLRHSVPKTKYPCSVEGCPYTSAMPSRVKFHEQDVHGVKYKCPEQNCTFSTGRKPRLAIHRLKAHTPYENRPFKCPWENQGKSCAFAAWTERELEDHHKRTHALGGQGPRKMCNICKKLQSNLIVHMRTHTREKPYKCTLCPRSFAVPGNLAKHQRLHDDDKSCLYQSDLVTFFAGGSVVGECKAHPKCKFRARNAKEMAGHLMSQHDLPRVSLFRLD